MDKDWIFAIPILELTLPCFFLINLTFENEQASGLCSQNNLGGKQAPMGKNALEWKPGLQSRQIFLMRLHPDIILCEATILAYCEWLLLPFLASARNYANGSLNGPLKSLENFLFLWH